MFHSKSCHPGRCHAAGTSSCAPTDWANWQLTRMPHGGMRQTIIGLLLRPITETGTQACDKSHLSSPVVHVSRLVVCNDANRQRPLLSALLLLSRHTCAHWLASSTQLRDENRLGYVLQGWAPRDIPGFGESKCASGDHAPGTVSNRQGVNLKIASFLPTIRMAPPTSILNVAVASCVDACLADKCPHELMLRCCAGQEKRGVLVETQIYTGHVCKAHHAILSYLWTYHTLRQTRDTSANFEDLDARLQNIHLHLRPSTESLHDECRANEDEIIADSPEYDGAVIPF